MSRGIYPFFEPPLPDEPNSWDGKHWNGAAVLEHLTILEDLAAVQGLVPLSTFMDSRRLFEDERGALNTPTPTTDDVWDQGFAVEAGSSAVEALLNALWKDDNLQASLDNAPRVLEELEYLAARLRIGKLCSSWFRFEVI